MAIALTKIDINPVTKIYTCVATQDASVAAQSIYCGFTPKIVTIYRTDTAGNLIYAVNTSTPGATSGLTGVTFQTTAAGLQTIVGSNPVVFLSGAEAAPAAAASGQPAQPSQANGFTIGSGCLTASSTLYIIAEG